MATKTHRRQAGSKRYEAMQHPLRRAVLLMLIERGPLSPSEMAIELDEPVGNVSHHTKKLVKLDCAELVEERPVRGSVKHFYRATDRYLIDTEEWEGLDPAIREDILVDCMQTTVNDYTASVKAGILGSNEDFVLTRTPFRAIDQEGLKEMTAIHERAFHELMEIPARCAERLRASGERPIAVSSSQGCFEVPPWGTRPLDKRPAMDA